MIPSKLSCGFADGFVRAERLVIFPHRFGVAFGHGVAINWMKRVRLLAPVQFLSQPRARVLQRCDHAHFDKIPLRRFAFALIGSPEFLRSRARSGELIAQSGVFHQFLNGTQTLSPFAKPAARQRSASRFRSSSRFTKFARELFKTLLVASCPARAAGAATICAATALSGLFTRCALGD